MNLTLSLDERLAAVLLQEAAARGFSAEQAAQDLLGGALSKIAEQAALLRAHQRRSDLIGKSRAQGLSAEERAELEQLQATVDQRPAPIDPIALHKRFHENRNRFPAEQLAAYAGQMAAWWPDGSRIFDADADHRDLFRRLRDAGYRISFFQLEWIPLPGEPKMDPYTLLRMQFAENRNDAPVEELAKYGGKLVAWWPDATRIVDADHEGDGHAFFERLDATGYERSWFVYENLPFPGESFV